MPHIPLLAPFSAAVRDGAVDPAERRKLEADLRKLPAAKRQDGARLLDLIRHDGELSRDEVGEARRLLRRLGVEAPRIPAALKAQPQCNLDLRHLELEVDLHRQPFAATATYVLGGAHRDEAILDASSERLRIAKVTVDGREVAFVHEHNRLRFSHDLAAGARLAITYSIGATKDADAYGLLAKGGAIVAQLWPEHFAKVVPGDGRPGKVLTADLVLRAPEGMVVAAAGAPLSREDGVYKHRLSTPAPQYSISFAALAGGEIVRDGVDEMAFIGVRSPGERGKRVRMLEVARHTRAFMKAWFGDSRFGTVHQIAEIPSALGGMEIPQSIQVARGNTRTLRDAAEVVAHEMIHHWFGNGVRIKSSADLWLSEGFTTYLTWRAEEARGGPDRWDELLAAGVQEARAALEARRASTTKYPLRPSFDHIATESIFDGVSYELGALALCAMERELGRPRFDALLAAWYQHASGKAVDTDGFFAFVAERTPLDVTAFRRRWVDALPSSEDMDALVRSLSRAT